MSELSRVGEFRVMIYPKNFQETRSFYERVLEYPVTHEWDHGEEDRGVMFNTGSATIELLSRRGNVQQIQGLALSLEVRDVRALYERVKDKVNVIFEVRHNAWGDTSFGVTDPEGLKLIFFTKD